MSIEITPPTKTLAADLTAAVADIIGRKQEEANGFVLLYMTPHPEAKSDYLVLSNMSPDTQLLVLDDFVDNLDEAISNNEPNVDGLADVVENPTAAARRELDNEPVDKATLEALGRRTSTQSLSSLLGVEKPERMPYTKGMTDEEFESLLALALLSVLAK